MKQVHKFGGASTATADRFVQTASIIEGLQHRENCLVVISARGKTTNDLESLLHAYLAGESGAWDILAKIRNEHQEWLTAIFSGSIPPDLDDAINNYFVELEWAIEDAPRADYGFEYDQIVSMGELISSTALSAYLNSKGIQNNWIDARDWLKTDNRYRKARVQWTETQSACRVHLDGPGLKITQGFIGCTSENFTTTLGREGSDYSAAIAAQCMGASQVTVWKDVPGMMTADPNASDSAVLIDHLNYREAIELAYYGAKVLHPKTLHPLIESSIPLIIRSFLEPHQPGTTIDQHPTDPPESIIRKSNQFLISLRKPTLSFVDDAMIARALQILHGLGLESNMLHQSAVTLSIVLNHPDRQLDALLNALQEHFRTTYNSGLELVTVRHGSTERLEQWKNQPGVLLEQSTRDTFQWLIQSPLLNEKAE